MKKYLFIILAFIPYITYGQELASEETTSEQLAEAHFIASFVKSFDHGLELTIEEEIRSYPSCRSHTSIGLGYTPIPYLSFGVNYVLKLYGNQGWDDPNKFLRHRVNVDATGQVTLGQWKLSLRERLMMDGRADDIDRREKNALDLVLRSRVQAAYAIPNVPLSIVSKMEVFNTLNAKYFGQYINELRPEIGLQWKVNKKNTLNIAYRYNYIYSREIDILDSGKISLTHDYSHKHVILLTYKFVSE